MKYQIQLTNGGKVMCDHYQILKNNVIVYKNGTLEVMMKEDQYVIDSIERIRVKK